MDEVSHQDGVVVKRHGGSDGLVRALTAAVAMGAATAAGLPVPPVEGVEGGELRTTRVAHAATGVALLQRDPKRMLERIGSFAAALHAVAPPPGLPQRGQGGAWVHGDLCPVNVLVDDDDDLVGVVDWEDSHVGDHVIDLAWTEWLVRVLHPSAVPALPTLYDAYGSLPAEAARRTAMQRCLGHQHDRAPDPDERALWTARLARLPELALDLP